MAKQIAKGSIVEKESVRKKLEDTGSRTASSFREKLNTDRRNSKRLYAWTERLSQKISSETN